MQRVYAQLVGVSNYIRKRISGSSRLPGCRRWTSEWVVWEPLQHHMMSLQLSAQAWAACLYGASIGENVLQLLAGAQFLLAVGEC